MKRKSSKNLLAVCMILAICLVAWRAGSIQGGVRKFEIKPEISLYGSRTDAVYAIGFYESVMNRLMDMTERNLTGINADVKDISRMLVTIDLKLSELSKRLSKIEQALSAGAPRTDPTKKFHHENAKVKHNGPADQKTYGASDANSEAVETR